MLDNAPLIRKTAIPAATRRVLRRRDESHHVRRDARDPDRSLLRVHPRVPDDGMAGGPARRRVLVAFVGGVAVAVAAANVLFRDVEHLVASLLLPWFFLTPVLYSFDQIAASSRHARSSRSCAGGTRSRRRSRRSARRCAEGSSRRWATSSTSSSPRRSRSRSARGSSARGRPDRGRALDGDDPPVVDPGLAPLGGQAGSRATSPSGSGLGITDGQSSGCAKPGSARVPGIAAQLALAPSIDPPTTA